MKIGMHIRPVNEESTWLLKHRRNVTSQSGEDGIIAKIFEVLRDHAKVCVELGAWDGKHHSNTYDLIRSQGWSGYLIEANAEKFKALEENYRGVRGATLIQRRVRLDPGQGTLDEVLAEHKCPEEVDLLSIDIDGNDYYVWEGLTRYSPKVVLIEFNPTVPNDVLFVQDRSFEVNQGCSLLALTELAQEKGYQLVCATETNAFFVSNELFAQFGIADNSPDAMYRPTMNGRIFHGYDGAIHVVGMPRLLWHNVELCDEDFQVLPRHVRVWSDAQ